MEINTALTKTNIDIKHTTSLVPNSKQMFSDGEIVESTEICYSHLTF